MGPCAMAAESGKLQPRLSSIGCAEYCGVLHPRVYGIRIAERRFKVPDPLEFPRVRRAVVPLMSAGNAVVNKFVTYRLPRLAPVIRALDLLPKPAAGLRCIQPVGINGRAFQMVNFPASKERAADNPPLPLPIRRQDESTFPRTHQHPYSAHLILLFEFELKKMRALPFHSMAHSTQKSDAIATYVELS